MTRIARFNANVAPLLVPLLAPAGLLMAGIGQETVRTPAFVAMGSGWLVLVGLSTYWRLRARRVSGGRRPGLGIACWVFAGLTTMLLVYRMLWGFEHAGSLLAEGREVISRGVQAVAFYVAAAWVSTRPPKLSASVDGAESS